MPEANATCAVHALPIGPTMREQLTHGTDDRGLNWGTGDEVHSACNTAHLISLPLEIEFIVPQITNAPLRLLTLVGTAEIGGTERFVAALMAGLDRREFAPAICVVNGPGDFSEPYARSADALWHLGRGGVSAPLMLAAWQDVLLSWRPDLLMLCGFRANMIGRFINGGVPVINALRSIVLDDKGRRLAHWIDRVTFGRVAMCVSNSRAAIDRHVAAGFPADRFEWIQNGVDVPRFRRPHRADVRTHFGVAHDDRIVLTVANLRPVKNLPLLLQASRRLHDFGVMHTVWIVGEGPDREVLTALAADLGLSASVQWLGAATDIPERYAAADVFVLSSHFEGMPTVVIEAFAAGLPVVATSVGDVPLLCRDTGLLVPPGDDVAMAQALQRILTDVPFRDSLRASARMVGEGFSLARMTEKYSEVFRRTARRRRP